MAKAAQTQMVLIQIYGTERSGSSLLGAQLGMGISDAACVGEYQFVAMPAVVQPEDQLCICGDPDCADAKFQIKARDGFNLGGLFERHAVVVDTSKQIYWYQRSAEIAKATGTRVYRVLILPRPEAFARSKHKRSEPRFALKYLVYNFVADRFCGIDRVVALEDLVSNPAKVLTEVCEDLELSQRMKLLDMHHIFGSRTLRKLGAEPVRQRKRATGVALPLSARLKSAMLSPFHAAILRRPHPRSESGRVQSLFRRPFQASRKQE